MLFNSFEFLLFFPIVTVLFFSIPHQFRWMLLLFASCFFYMFFKPVYILILAFTIIIDYIAGILIERQKEKNKRKFLLLTSLIANVGVLAIFKYYNFIALNVNSIFESFNENASLALLNILLPIGLSFHTFQAMSYTIEVYRGNQKAEKHFGLYALYVMFYPQLVAGPIERPQNVLHQFHEVKHFDADKFESGMRLILWGLVKKTVIADRLALPVNELFNTPYAGWSGLAIIIATIFFSIQIYCDFSGYSDIAIGTARTMGYNLMVNFRQPYLSSNIREFWSRWHISLSTWFRDYVYIPLGGNRGSKHKTYLNLFIVFILSGIWHGANWTYIVWGALHGLFIVTFLAISPMLNKVRYSGFINILVTYIVVCMAWIYFRASDIQQANHLVATIFKPDANYLTIGKTSLHGLPNSFLGLPFWKFVLTGLLVPVVFLSDLLINSQQYRRIFTLPSTLRWSGYYALIIAVIFLGVYETNQFIYFQF